MASLGGVKDWAARNKKRIAVGVATGGISEGYGLKTAYDAAKKGGPAEGVGDAIKSLGKGVAGMFTGPEITPYQPSQNTSSFGDPHYNRGGADTAAVRSTQREALMHDAQNRSIDTSGADAARDRVGRDAAWFRTFAEQGPGRSLAEAQLQESQNSNMRQALAMAGSARGNMGGNAALADAAQNRAIAQGQAAGDLAQLRAQEQDMWRQRQMESQKTAADLTNSIRAGDMQQLGLMLQNRQVNDAFSVAMGEQGLSAEQIRQRWAQMDGEQRLAFEQMIGDYFMQAQTKNAEFDMRRDAALIAALGGVTEAGIDAAAPKLA